MICYFQVGDYWVIYLLSKNLNPIAMKELLVELQEVIFQILFDELDLLNPGDGSGLQHLQAGLPRDG